MDVAVAMANTEDNAEDNAEDGSFAERGLTPGLPQSHPESQLNLPPNWGFLLSGN